MGTYSLQLVWQGFASSQDTAERPQLGAILCRRAQVSPVNDVFYSITSSDLLYDP